MMPDTMTDALLNRYAALEPRLPEGWPRLEEHGIKYEQFGICRSMKWQVCSEHGTTRRSISDLERGYLAVLVLRAGREQFCKRESLRLHNDICDALTHGKCDSDDAIDRIITTLETAYPKETTP